MKLKGEMSMLNVLHLQESDLELTSLQVSLEKKRDEAPQFFIQSPLVVDCSDLAEQCNRLDFGALRAMILELGFIPVGVRSAPKDVLLVANKAGWAIMREGHAPSAKKQDKSGQADNHQSASSNGPASDNSGSTEKQTQAQSTIQSLTIERPVRSGQQVYAANGDMTILAPTSSGSELVADGSIHVYGALRGRVLAGARGNVSARIFCHSLQAELIAIAGRYQLLDESDTDLKGKPAMIRLEGEKLIIEPLG